MIDTTLYPGAWDETTQREVLDLPGPILISGVSGFIGANLFTDLSKYREDVFGFSRKPKYSWRLASLPQELSRRLVSLDITENGKVSEYIHFLKPRTVFSLAAYGAYARQTDSERIHRTNYLGALNLLRALSDTGCEAFVHAGSSSEYGLNCNRPREDGELIPNSDYAVSKIGVAYLIKYYGRLLHFPCVNLRLYSAYGPWEERDRLIPTLVSGGLKGILPKFVDKNISRDFLYISDCTAAMIKSALTLCRTRPGDSVNIGSGERTTIENLAETARTVFGIGEKPVFGSMRNRKWDLSDWVGDSSLAHQDLGWHHTVSLEQGLRLTAEWEKRCAVGLKYVSVPAKQKKISAIIACYKDEKAVPILHERLTQVFQKTGYDYEIIFVNDNSPLQDESAIKALSDRDYHVIGVSHSRNFGSQSAFLSGMEIATGDAVVLMDGDGQDPPEVIEHFAKKWEEGFDVVYGERPKREAAFFMQIFYKLFYRLFRRLANINIPVDAGDFSLIDRKAVAYLLRFPEKDVFLRGLRAWIGFRQTGVPYHRPERLFGKSTNSLLKNIWWAKKAIFSFSMKPLHYIQTLGIAVFFITAGLSLFYLIHYLIQPPKNAAGTTTIILLVLGLSGIQLISISIIGDYVSKIIEEVKNRPRFIRNKIVYNGKIYDQEDKIMELMNELSGSHKTGLRREE